MWAYLNVGVKETETRKRKRKIGREREITALEKRGMK